MAPGEPDGSTALAWTPDRPGLYEISWEGVDEREVPVRDSFRVWVAGEGAQEGLRPDQAVELVAERSSLRAGEVATLIGRQAGARQSAEDVAAAAGGIAYSILTGIGPRVRRNVLEEDR